MRSWFSWRQGLTTQFFFFVILPLTTALVAVALGSQSVHQQAMRAMVAERDARAIHAGAAAIAEQLAERGRLVSGIAQALSETDGPGLATYGFVAASFEGGLALYASDGSLLESGAATTDWSRRPIAAALTDWPTDAAVYISPAFADADGNTWVAVAARTVDGRRVVGAFSPEALARRSLDVDPGVAMEHGGAMSWILVDRNARVLFKTGTLLAEAPLAEHPGVREALQGENGTQFLPGENGQEHVVAYAAIAPAGWALLSEEPWDQVEGPLLRSTLVAPLILIPAIVLAMVVLGFGLRQIVQPLRALERQAAELGQGDFKAVDRPVGGIAEIQRLQAELARMSAKVRQAQASLRGYVGAVTAGQEEERRRLARELHDDTVQALIALDQRAQLAQRAATQAPPDARARLAEVRAMTSALINDVRRVIRAMRPIYLEDLGLLPAIEMLARDIESVNGLRVAYDVSGPVRRLTGAQEIGLYRIVQEALSNAARHAQANSLTVSVRFTDDATTVQIVDDGCGFAVPDRLNAEVTEGHFGLMGMQERAELIGGHLDIRSAAGQGTTVTITLPA